MTFLAFYYNEKSHTSGSVSTFVYRPHPTYPTDTFPPRIQFLYAGIVSLYPRICDHVSAWTRSHMSIRPHSHIPPWIHLLIPRIRFLYPGFTSFIQDSLPLRRIHFL
ncbi:hypothetical protein BD311DRAFT_351927 [Dichomitus squalens]|uniref:Uncharacterized protein n=1 Tax=Dichomitus squalens TaxID=114155 RepID=A0A4Q9N1J3_9APHY|nr:hypothetical protein BD311DRAFT_351927 [Dichomitus squalens]